MSAIGFLTEYLTALGVSPEIAAQDACRMEHVISQESFDKIARMFQAGNCDRE